MNLVITLIIRVTCDFNLLMLFNIWQQVRKTRCLAELLDKNDNNKFVKDGNNVYPPQEGGQNSLILLTSHIYHFLESTT